MKIIMRQCRARTLTIIRRDYIIIIHKIMKVASTSYHHALHLHVRGKLGKRG